MDFENILLDVQDGIARITLNRPAKRNALNYQTLEEIFRCFDSLLSREDVQTAVLTGAGDKAFAAGADINELALLDAVEAHKRSKRGNEILQFIENLGKPVIAAVNGDALGGGCELAMACNLRIASENARFGQPEVKLGVIPGYGGTQRLPRLVGKSKALEMLLTGEWIRAEEALRVGLVSQVVPLEQLLPAAESLARKIMANGPVAVCMVLEAVNRGLEMPLDQGVALESGLFGKDFATEDMKEGMRAFFEKRPAKFRGK